MEENKVLKRTPLATWKKYLFEFLMVFLAVTMGFFVDNLRSDIADRQLENQHIQSLLSDLKQDTTLFDKQLKGLNYLISMCDSVCTLLHQATRTSRENQRLYLLTRLIAPNTIQLYLNDRTFDEMRSSGALRLIHVKYIADSISQYYFIDKDFSFINQIMLDRAQRRLELEAQIFDASVYETIIDKKTFVFVEPAGNPQLINNDKKTINELLIMTHYIASASSLSKFLIEKSNTSANRLIKMLEREYQLK